LAAAPTLSLASPVQRDAHGVLWRLADDGSVGEAKSAPPPAAAEATAHDAAELAALRLAARLRSARPRIGRVSDRNAIPGELLSREGSLDRALARARGIALHRALELERLEAEDPDAWRAAVEASFRTAHPAASARDRKELSTALEGLRSSLLWKSLSSLEEKSLIRAHELPLLIAGDSGADLGPIDGHVGTLDLLYRDPVSGGLVVADFKSDRIEDVPGAVAALVARYRPQLALYGSAVRGVLGLDAAPRLELWLLRADRIVEVAPEEPPRDSG
jgi:ATP-dependent exoDNAse (exonuclease V) beta subunit